MTDRAITTVALLGGILLLSACASQVGIQDAASADTAAPSDVAECHASLSAAEFRDSPDLHELDTGNIRLLNWNAQKNKRLNWQQELESLSSDMNLVLVQEASLRKDSINSIDSSRYWSFAPGYRSSGAVSGVLTMSSSKPIAQCSFVSYEPLLRTPKATSVSKYRLTSTDATLLVVNLHAVNFSMGLGAFKRQFDQVRRILEVHDGPIILSGDFNTWRRKRSKIVANIAQSLGLTALDFPDDNRVKKFGNYVDHIFVRGLLPVDSSTTVVDSSDHNPMSVTLRM
ncbi:MAG: endonuclease/exonuclease/phosphatase family protein [Gammaproteobacteria bacterium]|nr:endonuclease/exonuclease/phosphatase family protein [Gammaproteobacteria bacterium]MDH4315718.1 endonuclease/exonuclease/phosphatase family protein [Gammaproteobacteria bacterium]MDH5213448.1 endonuclease/exonuclease/phosphatase family protein [Gammaproteobacteria bacterium]MDH5499724.1 endonuclease/exonuclease/phosphatase family protein [Gammaproteobacteria bacterium]